MDERETPPAATIRALAGPFKAIQWGNRWLYGFAKTFREWYLLFLSPLVVAAIVVVATYATPFFLAKSNTFSNAALYGLNADHIAIATAAALVVAMDLLASLRTWARTSEQAILFVFCMFVVSVFAVVWSGHELTVHNHVWLIGPAVIVGITYGVSLAALLDLAQAVAVGIVTIVKLKDIADVDEADFEAFVTSSVPAWLGFRQLVVVVEKVYGFGRSVSVNDGARRR